MIVALCCALAVLCWPGRPALRAADALVRLGGSATQGAEGHTGSRWRRRARGVIPRRGDRIEQDQILSLLDGLAAALRAGLPTVEALTVVSSTLAPATRSVLVGPVLSAAREGRASGPVLRRHARRTGDRDLAALARAWELSERVGIPLADAVSTAAQVGRARMAHRHRVTTATAGARATSGLLTALPVGGLGVAALLGLAPTEVYDTPWSLASLGMGVLLLLAGRRVVTWMVRRVEEDGG